MRPLAATTILLLGAALAWAAPPSLEVPAEVRPAGDYALVMPKTDAVSVTYIGLSGVDPFPSVLLKDARQFALHVRGLAPGRYKFAAVAAGKDGEQVRADFVVVVGDAPIPPIPPVPPGPNPPTPPNPPAPVPDVGLHVLIVFDKRLDSLSAEQRNVIGSTAPEGCRAYLTAKCATVAGKADWAFWPDGADATLYPSAPLRAMYARKRASLPWVAISKDGKEGFEGPLPATEAECLALFKRYGG